MAAGFQLPPGDPDALDTALTALGAMAGDLKRQGSSLQSGFGQAIATWKAPRAQDFQRAATGIRSQACNAQTSIEGAVDVLGTYAQVLRRGREDIADLARQAHHREQTTRDDISGMDPGSPHATQAEQHTTAFVGHLQAEAAVIRGHVRRAAEQAAQSLDQATGSVVPGGATLDPNAIRQQVDHAYGVEATRAALAGQQLTENDAWSALAGAQVSAPPDDWRKWAQAYGLTAPETFDPARGADLKQALEAELSQGLSLPPDQRAQLIEKFTDTLSQQDQVQLAMFDPTLVGNLDGIPNPVRYVANKVNVFRAVESEQDRLDAWQPPPTNQDPAYVDYVRLKGRIFMLSQLLEDKEIGKAPGPHQVLAFVPPTYQGFHTVDDGRLAVAVGNLDQAQHVGVVVPGITNRIDNFDETLAKAVNTSGRVPGSATVAWLGYDTPEFQDSMTTGDAVRGGHALHDFLAGLQRDPTSDLVVMAHSYGTLVTSKALQFRKAGEAPPDRIVLFGSPGLGENVHNTADLGLPPGYPIYALRAPGDPVAITAGHGTDAVAIPGITRLDTDWTGNEDVTGHSQYTVSGTDSLANIGWVLSGEIGSLHVGGNALADDGLAGPYNQNLRNLVDLLQQRVPNDVTSAFVGGMEAELERRVETGDWPSLSDPSDVPELTALLRSSARDSGLTDHLTQDEFEQAVIDAGFTRTAADQAGDQVHDFIDGLDQLDNLRIPIAVPLMPGWHLNLGVPGDLNERVAATAAAGTRIVGRTLADTAVRNLPSLSKVLGYADTVVHAYEKGNEILGEVRDTLDTTLELTKQLPGLVEDQAVDTFQDGVDTAKELGSETVDRGEDVVKFLVPGI